MNWDSQPGQLTLSQGVPGGLGHRERGHGDALIVPCGGNRGGALRGRKVLGCQGLAHGTVCSGFVAPRVSMLHTEFGCSWETGRWVYEEPVCPVYRMQCCRILSFLKPKVAWPELSCPRSLLLSEAFDWDFSRFVIACGFLSLWQDYCLDQFFFYYSLCQESKLICLGLLS